VCTSCGSLSECPHDVSETREDISSSAPGGDTADPENTNAELLVRYGFILDANDNDILTWTTEEIWDAAGAALADLRPRRWDDDAGYGACMEILRDWQNDAGWADSELVIDTEPDENRNRLYMTADGVLSHKLWLAIALAALSGQDATTDVAITRQLIEGMARVQTQMEKGETRAQNEGSDEDDDAYKVCAYRRVLLAYRVPKADIENRKIKSFGQQLFAKCHCSGRKTRVRLPPVTRNMYAGVGQADSHDRGIVRAEVGSDFPFKHRTAGRSRS